MCTVPPVCQNPAGVEEEEGEEEKIKKKKLKLKKERRGRKKKLGQNEAKEFECGESAPSTPVEARRAEPLIAARGESDSRRSAIYIWRIPMETFQPE